MPMLVPKLLTTAFPSGLAFRHASVQMLALAR